MAFNLAVEKPPPPALGPEKLCPSCSSTYAFRGQMDLDDAYRRLGARDLTEICPDCDALRRGCHITQIKRGQR